MPAPTGDVGEFLADVRALDAAGAEMILVPGGDADTWIVLGAVAALTDRIRLWVDEPGAARVLQRITGGRVVSEHTAGWIAMTMPPDRESWAAAMREHEAGGADGVVVEWDPRLIDLLRNPQPDDRSDLLMSTG
jgi:hypothetical protein